MRLASGSVAFFLCMICSEAAWSQTAASSARIDTTSLRLTMPDPYQVLAVLEPIRSLTIIAPADGVIRSVEARPGSPVRESQELAQFDREEASAKLLVAQAEVKEKQAALKVMGTDVARAQLEAAEARVLLAKIELDRCTIRAPFPGRILNVFVCAGQFVVKGTPILELADTTSLRVVLPVDRRGIAVGSKLTVVVEEQEVACKVQAILPLPESFSVLRELATPFAAASVLIPNPKGELEPGLRARPSGVPTTAITAVPRRAIRPDELRGPSASMVQVIRNEYVTNVPVQVLGSLGNDRIQVSGLLRETDALIIGSSVPLAPGTLVRFAETSGPRGIEGTSPDPARSGIEAGITPPGVRPAPATSGRTGAATRRTNPASGSSSTPSQPQAGGGGVTPF
jgi:biotin carboxyl carrier protein